MLMFIKKNLKIIKTIDVYLALFCAGLSISVTGPCLLDLQQAIGTDTHHIALIYTCRSVGYLVGGILGGILLDMVPSKFCVLTACNFLTCVTNLGIPWSRDVYILLSIATINGISVSAINTGCNVICIELWHRGPYLQALHFLFGLGGLLAPLFAAPFLEYQNKVEVSFKSTSNFTTNVVDVYSNLTTSSVHNGIPKVTYPFCIVGVICFFVTILLLMTLIASPRDEKESSTDKEDNSHRGYVFMFFVSILTFLTFFIVTGAEFAFAQALTTYAVKGPLHVTTVLGSYMTSAFWTAFTIMRLICIFLSIKLNDMTLIVIDLILLAVAGILLMFFMPNTWVLWAACITCGAGLSSSFASLVGWLDQHIVVTSKISSIFSVGCAAGEMVIPFIITYFMDSIPEMLVYVTAATSISILVLLLILSGIFKNGKRTSKENNCS